MLLACIMKNDWPTFRTQGNNPQENDSFMLRSTGLIEFNKAKGELCSIGRKQHPWAEWEDAAGTLEDMKEDSITLVEEGTGVRDRESTKRYIYHGKNFTMVRIFITLRTRERRRWVIRNRRHEYVCLKNCYFGYFGYIELNKVY